MNRPAPYAGFAGFAAGVIIVGGTGVHAKQWADEVTSAVLLVALCAFTLGTVRRWLTHQAEQNRLIIARYAPADESTCSCGGQAQRATLEQKLTEEQNLHRQARSDYEELAAEHNTLIQQTMQAGYEAFLPRDASRPLAPRMVRRPPRVPEPDAPELR